MRLITPAIGIDPGLAAVVARYSAAGIAANTARAYRSAWAAFAGWCQSRALESLPAAAFTCAAYLADRAGSLHPGTLAVHLAAIRQRHAASNLDSPTTSSEVVGVMRGIRREHGRPPRKKSPVSAQQLRLLLQSRGQSLADQRDRALLLLGFCAGLRRSELVALDVADVVFEDSGLLVTLRRTKTEFQGQGRVVAVESGLHSETCPRATLKNWLLGSGIANGPLFRGITRYGTVGHRRLSGRAVARILQRRAAAASLGHLDLAGHSLRSGFATAAAAAQVAERDIAERTGHRNLGVLRGYIHQADPFAQGLTQRLGF